MLTIALTGGIACGKSATGAIFEALGWGVCESDRLAHDAMRPGAPAFTEVVAAFGRAILGPDGAIDRAKLGAVVFADAAARERLNAIVHPRVRAAWIEWLDAQRHAGAQAALVIVPLLYEAGLAAGWDAVVCVTASEALQRHRMRARGLNEQQTEQRLRAQWPVAVKAQRADYVIVNDGTEAELGRRVAEVARQILESKHGRTR